MQEEHRPTQTLRRPTRLVKYPYPFIEEQPTAPESTDASDSLDVVAQPTTRIKPVKSSSLLLKPPFHFSSFPTSDPGDISNQATHLMQLSGMMRPVRVPSQQPGLQNDTPISGSDEYTYSIEEEYWPDGIQQTGPLPVINLYGSEPFGRILPTLPTQPVAAISLAPAATKQQPLWKTILNAPAVKITLGLLVGLGLLYLVSRFVNITTALHVLQQNLATPRGIIFGLLSGIAFLTAFCIRGVRWKLFLNPIGKVSTLKAIQLFLIGIFLNFLLPIRGGEVAKSLILKRTAGIPVSQSLPTVAMDKALDLMPAFFIMALVPLLGITMNATLWLVLGAVGGLLLCLVFFAGLAAWKRGAAIALLQKMTTMLPKAIAGRIEGFATGFVDSLLMAASRPSIFIPAILLTCVAVIFDGLFAMLAFRTIGFPISFGTAIFGYSLYNMFYILPTPPGQIGSNEFVGLLVFHALLGLPADKVTAMFVFSHPEAALLMTITGMACLSTLGLTISTAMKVQAGQDNTRTT